MEVEAHRVRRTRRSACGHTQYTIACAALLVISRPTCVWSRTARGAAIHGEPLRGDKDGKNLSENLITSRSRACAQWGALLLFLLTAIVFSPVLGHRFIVSWDDRTAILANPDYNPPSVGHLVHYWTRPPAKSLFYVPITYTIWGALAAVARHSAPAGVPFNPAFFYGANLLAHAVSAVLVFLILRRLVWADLAAWIGAGVFALHPIQVEAVSTAWDLYTPLSAAFSLLAIWRYLVFSDQRQSDHVTTRTRGRWNYAIASFSFACALLTKPTVAITPLIIAAIELGMRGRRPRSLIGPLAPWLIAAGVIVWLDQRIPAAGRAFVPDWWIRPMVPLDAIAFYLGKILFPVRLCMDYGRTPWSVAGRPAVRATYLITFALFAAAWLARKRWPVVVTGFAIFVVALLPTTGIVPFTFQYYSTVADRYAYLAMLGPVLVVAACISKVPAKWAISGGSAVLSLLAVLSVLQLRHWRDDWQLAVHTVQINPVSIAGAGTFKFLLAEPPADLPGSQSLAIPPCSLDSRELIQAGKQLEKGGFPYISGECYRRAHEESEKRRPLPAASHTE